jgi:hypothetical protein
VATGAVRMTLCDATALSEVLHFRSVKIHQTLSDVVFADELTKIDSTGISIRLGFLLPVAHVVVVGNDDFASLNA